MALLGRADNHWLSRKSSVFTIQKTNVVVYRPCLQHVAYHFNEMITYSREAVCRADTSVVQCKGVCLVL